MATEYKKIVIRKGTQSEFNTLQSSTAPLLEAELGFITDENELVIGTSAGNSLSINKDLEQLQVFLRRGIILTHLQT